MGLFGITRAFSAMAKRGVVVFIATLIGMFAGALCLAYLLASELYDYQDTVDGVRLPAVDAIVCLAGGRGRIGGAADIWLRYQQGSAPGRAQPSPPVLYVSGMGPQSNWRVFSRQVRGGVKEVIRPENVVMETESINTDANARWLMRYALKNRWKRVLLITSPYHMKRARYIFEKVADQANAPLSIDTLTIYQEPFEPGEWQSSVHGIRVTLLEYLKWIYYRYFWTP